MSRRRKKRRKPNLGESVQRMFLVICLIGISIVHINAGLSLARQSHWTGVAIIGALLAVLLGVTIISFTQERRRR
jgi:uncharacterized membrane protein HdeD (DUF308 family)